MPDDVISTALIVVGAALVIYSVVQEIRTRRRR